MVSVANGEAGRGQDLPGDGLALTDVCATPALGGPEVVAGAAAAPTAVVAGVNVMEVPDVLDWVRPRELLLTTGFPLLGHDGALDVPALLELVRGLAEAGVAAFGVKRGRYVDDLPTEVLTLADEVGLPVLRLGADVAFDDVLREVYGDLHAFAAGVLARVDALHAALTMIVLEGGDLGDIAAEVARVLDVGVVLTSTDGRPWASACDDDHRAALDDADAVDETGRVRVERFRHAPMALRDGELRLMHVAAAGAELARLVVVSPGRPLPPSDVRALERAGQVAALLVTRQQAITAVEAKYRGDFLRDVFQSRAGTADYVVEHAAGLGWDVARPLVVLVAQLDPPAADEPRVSSRVRRGWQDRFAAAWRQVVESHDRSAPVADFTAEVVALLPVAGLDQDGVETLVRRMLAAVRGDSGGGRRSFSAGVSRVVDGIDALPEAYGHARKAVEVGRRVHGRGSSTFFDELGVRRLLSLVEDPAELRTFVREVLGELASDEPTAVDLRGTLQVLIDTNLNVAEAARVQHFHYNTMRYRVAKLEQLVGPFTRDPGVRLDAAVALQILQMAH